MSVYLSGLHWGGVILDPFMGTATTAVAALALHRHYVGFELNKEYYDIALKRISEQEPVLI